MAQLFTKYIQGESVYSYVARIHWFSTSMSWKETNKIIFDAESVRLHSLLPAHLQQISEATKTDIASLLTYATGYPLFEMGLTSKSAKFKLMHTMLGSKGSLIGGSARQASCKINIGHYFSFCAKCFLADEVKFGSGYWHTSHQLAGVSVCPVHCLKLIKIPAGDGGINHSLKLPFIDKGMPGLDIVEKELYLSSFVIELQTYLCRMSRVEALSEHYRCWLESKGYLTQGGNLRWKILKTDLIYFWQTLFNQIEPVLPLELSEFVFVPSLVHSNHNTHYIKHVLLMAFLARTPVLFFRGPLREVIPSPVVTAEVIVDEEALLSMLRDGCSMRQVSAKFRCSMGFIKQLALRNQICIECRRQYITSGIERDVWRKAFIGSHRQSIADEFDISVAAVEQIIQSHKGLSQWRHHLIMANRLRVNRQALVEFISTNPSLSRNTIKQQCRAYMWLYKNDKEWLYENLPAPRQCGQGKSVNWVSRDIAVLAQLMGLNDEYYSMSEIDRKLGGHGWLLHDRLKLPRSLAYAQGLLISRYHK